MSQSRLIFNYISRQNLKNIVSTHIVFATIIPSPLSPPTRGASQSTVVIALQRALVSRRLPALNHALLAAARVSSSSASASSSDAIMQLMAEATAAVSELKRDEQQCANAQAAAEAQVRLGRTKRHSQPTIAQYVNHYDFSPWHTLHAFFRVDNDLYFHEASRKKCK